MIRKSYAVDIDDRGRARREAISQRPLLDTFAPEGFSNECMDAFLQRLAYSGNAAVNLKEGLSPLDIL